MIFFSRFLAQARNVNCFASGTIRILTASQDSNWFIEKEAGKSSQAARPSATGCMGHRDLAKPFACQMFTAGSMSPLTHRCYLPKSGFSIPSCK